MNDLQSFYNRIKKRYGEIDLKALEAVLSPLVIPIDSIDATIHKETGQSHWKAKFKIQIEENWRHLMQRGMTGKFVPRSYVEGNGVWREICKGRIVTIQVKLVFK